MYMDIENDISFPIPEADIDFVEVLGRDGDVAIDNQRLKSMNFSIPVRLRLPQGKDVNEVATQISNWLRNDIGWHDLQFSGSPDYKYVAIQYEQFDISETLKRYGKTVINFKVQPYKRKIYSQPVVVSNGMNIVNDGMRNSRPLIKLSGTGDIILQNNGRDWLKLVDVDQGITVDSEQMSVYRGTQPQYDKMINPGDFPILYIGNNVISWAGNVTRIEIEPRWEAIT